MTFQKFYESQPNGGRVISAMIAGGSCRFAFMFVRGSCTCRRSSPAWRVRSSMGRVQADRVADGADRGDERLIEHARISFEHQGWVLKRMAGVGVAELDRRQRSLTE